MRFDLAAILTRRIPIKMLALVAFFALYVAVTLLIFYRWMQPTLDGHSDQHIAADSTTYLYFADSLREGRNDPIVLAALTTFPNNLWSPVLLALVLKSTLAMAIANYGMFLLSLFFLKRSFAFSSGIFLTLLLINPTTTVSLLSVNKEVVDFLAVAMFLYGRAKGSGLAFYVSLLLALINRYELFVVLMIFLISQTKLNPVHGKRLKTLVLLVLALDILMPALGSAALQLRFQEASGGGLVTFLDTLQIHYLYILAVVPKIAENLFGELINVSKWGIYSMSDLANSYILLFNNIASAIVMTLLISKRRFQLSSDLIYLAMIGAVMMALALVIQPRYFYFVYVLCCLQAAQGDQRGRSSRVLGRAPEGLAYA